MKNPLRASVPWGVGAVLVGLCWCGISSTGDSHPVGDHVDLERFREGRALVQAFECNRCHEGTGLPEVPRDKHCVRCHQEIVSGEFEASRDHLERWRSNLVHFKHVPSLTALDARLRPSWLRDYLSQPHDLRPGLNTEMPQLALDPGQAEAIAAYFIPTTAPEEAPKGNRARGWHLLETRGCGTCHRFTGAEQPLPASPLPMVLEAQALQRGMILAPDLRHTRDRFRPGALVRWLQDPVGVKPDTAMPPIPLTETEAEDIATAILTTALAQPPSQPLPERLPILKRKVTFAEVDAAVFHAICWHCHSEPAYADGDGGPGNTGGFGFAGRGLNLSSYSAISMGLLDADGQRRSLFTSVSADDKTPYLIAVLRARQAEVNGRPVPGLRGMPLGLPPLSPEQIQLVDSWIAQGRPQ
ncbi:MAG: cytochrome C oxidase Cbb3 [Myxococcota bacterium]